MRNLFTHAIASLGLATLLIGSASAADMQSASTVRLVSTNLALQDQLERDATSTRLHQSPAGVVIGPTSSYQGYNSSGD